MEKSNISYSEAMAQIEAILNKLQSADCDIESLAENVKPEDVEAMAEFAPGKIVISRDSFADDTAMANAHYILRDRKIELKLV